MSETGKERSGGTPRPAAATTTPSRRSRTNRYDPEPVCERTVQVLLGETHRYRNPPPAEMEPQVREQADAQWSRRLNDGSRPSLVQKAHTISPGTPVQP